MSGTNGNGRPRGQDDPGAEPPELEEIAGALRGLVEARFPTLEPDEDVTQMTHVAGADGAVVVAHPFSNDEEKEMATEAVAAVIAQHRAEAFAQVFHGWAPPLDDTTRPGEPGFVPPREREDRREVVIVHASDGVRVLASQAEVGRDGKSPPTLGEWQNAEATVKEVGGDVFGPLVAAVVTNRIARASRELAFDPPEPRTEAQEEAFARIDEDLGSASDPEDLADKQRTLDDFVVLGILERGEDGNLQPSAAVIERAGLAEVWGERE